jgi:hypothetical protein
MTAVIAFQRHRLYTRLDTTGSHLGRLDPAA